MNIDPSTNLPELPEGNFWRVGPAGKGYEKYLQIELHRVIPEKRILGFVVQKESSRQVAYYFARELRANDGSVITTTEEDILDNAKRLWERYIAPPSAPHRPDLFGDYPPRKLGDSA